MSSPFLLFYQLFLIFFDSRVPVISEWLASPSKAATGYNNQTTQTTN